MIADEEYIRESILDPQAKIVAGYPPVMPTSKGQIDAQQLRELIEYIKSLGVGTAKGEAPPKPTPPENAP